MSSHMRKNICPAHRSRTGSSNPSPSSGESNELRYATTAPGQPADQPKTDRLPPPTRRPRRRSLPRLDVTDEGQRVGWRSELQRDVARLGFVVGQIKQLEEARQKRLEQPESERATGQSACNFRG
jgi:hypothetical protein